jgi:short-subunit dehydrogenase
MSEALRHELRPFGVRVTLIEPGDIQSDFTKARRTVSAAATNPAYREGLRRALAAAEKDERSAPAPEKVARTIERALAVRSPKLRYTVGMASQRVVALLRRLLPARAFEWLVGQAFQIGSAP